MTPGGRGPLPTPPTSPDFRVYPKSYGPSSTIRPPPGGVQTSPSTANYFNPVAPFDDVDGRMTTRGGSTFFAARKPLPFPGMAGGPSPSVPTMRSPPLSFNAHTSYAPPRQPQQLPPGAKPSFYQPVSSPPLPSPPAPMGSQVPLATSSSILVHSGFWQILQATGSRFLSPTTERAVFGDNSMLSGFLPAPNVTAPLFNSGQLAPPLEVSKKSNKRISVDMIGRPGQFAHLVHASSHEQAEDLLTRWHRDGQGKLGEPAWAQPIKEAARARQRARGVAEVQTAIEEHKGQLQVVNGLPSVVSTAASNEAIEDGPVSPAPTSPFTSPVLDNFQLQPPQAPFFGRTNTGGTMVDSSGTVRMSNAPPMSPGAELSFNEVLEKDEDVVYPMPKSFMPSLTTIEKAVATRVFFETHYHAILKKPRGRDQRKALLERELARLNISDLERRNVRDAWALSETEYLRDLRMRVDSGSFAKIKVIGHGAFGVVSLVREKSTGKLYAMKQLRKADMLKKGQEGHVRAERDLLASASSVTQWSVRLAYSFQDFDHLYLCMSYMQGGDLLTLLIEKDVFPESFARFYFAEMLLAVEETHTILGAVHRDIKPDNFLFDRDGHISISDFGLATDFHWAHDGAYFEQQRLNLLRKHGIDVADGKMAPMTKPFDEDKQNEQETPGSILTWRDRHRRRLAYSVVGTGNYMSYEVLRGNGYSQECDWWSLGVILFEMLYGYPPFVSKSRQQTRQKILNWRSHLKFPPKPKVSREAQNLIMSLICEREDRIGCRASGSSMRPNSVLLTQRRSGFLGNANDGANEIKAHPWFRGIDFTNMRQQVPPFVPQVKDEIDTRYFEDNIPDEPLPGPEALPGAPPQEETKDPMLRDKTHGAELLNVRKQLAFQGWTYRAVKNPVYDPQTGINLGRGKGKRPTVITPEDRGRSLVRSEGGSAFGRSLSI